MVGLLPVSCCPILMASQPAAAPGSSSPGTQAGAAPGNVPCMLSHNIVAAAADGCVAVGLSETAKELDAALERRRELREEIAAKVRTLGDEAAARKGAGSGRLKGPAQARKNKLEAEVEQLKRQLEGEKSPLNLSFQSVISVGRLVNHFSSSLS